MAILSKSGITNGATVQPGHVTQSVDAFTGLVAYDITLSGSYTLTGSFNQSGSARISGSLIVNTVSASALTGSFTGPLVGTASGASYINTNVPSFNPSGSGVNFQPGGLGVLAGSVKLASGVSAAINPTALSGKRFQTQYWVTATKASGSTSPSNNALMVQETAPSAGSFFIKDIGASTNDDVNFIIVYLQ
jgi:hypothetical protein